MQGWRGESVNVLSLFSGIGGIDMKLNFGCGQNYQEGYINIDLSSDVKTDKIVDLEKYPYPFDSNSADEITAFDILEHLTDAVKTLAEFHRILKKDGVLKITYPLFKYHPAHSDPTHKHFFSEFTHEYFTPISDYYVPGFPKFEVIKKSFITGKIMFWQKRWIKLELRPIKEALNDS